MDVFLCSHLTVTALHASWDSLIHGRVWQRPISYAQLVQVTVQFNDLLAIFNDLPAVCNDLMTIFNDLLAIFL